MGAKLKDSWPMLAREHLLASAAVKKRAAEELGPAIGEAARLLIESLSAGGKIMICGNGGSAADAQHIAAEFVSTLRQDFQRPAMAAIALTTDTSFMTARSNDYGFEGIFARQVEALGRPGDVLVGISTSGNSANVVQALARARQLGMKTIAMVGGGGGKLRELAHVCLCAPSEKVQHIQELHITLGHILAELVEEGMFS